MYRCVHHVAKSETEPCIRRPVMTLCNKIINPEELIKEPPSGTSMVKCRHCQKAMSSQPLLSNVFRHVIFRLLPPEPQPITHLAA